MQLVICNSFSNVPISNTQRNIVLYSLIRISFQWRHVKNGFHLEEIEVCGQKMLKRIFNFEWEEVNWIRQ